MYVFVNFLLILILFLGLKVVADDGNFHGSIQATDVTASGNFIGNGSLLTDLPNGMTIYNSVSHSLVTTANSTGFQISSTRKSFVIYSIKISTTATIGGSTEGEVYLETAATNSSTPSDWTTVSKISNGQSISLAIALQSVQPLTQQLIGMIPSGYYVRIRSNNVSGTPVYTYITGQEILL